MTTTTCTLTGKALAEEARRLDIPGRSKLSADDLRARIGEYRESIVRTYRAACTAYATNPTRENAQRLSEADSARESAGIRSVDIPTPDGCPDTLPQPDPDAQVAQVAQVAPVASPDWARTCCGCLVVAPTDGDMVTGLVRYPRSNEMRRVCRPCAARPLGTRPTERPDYAPETYTRPVWGDPDACPVTGLADCRDRDCELHYMSAPLRLPPVPFRARNGKHKNSRTRIHRRTRAI